MAGRKGSRSSKTDHVLSLLSGGAKEEHAPAPAAQEIQESPAVPEVEAAPAQTDAAAPAQEPAAPARPAVREGGLTAPILQVAKTNNEALSQTIRDALTQALEEELAQSGEASQGEPPQPESAPKAEPEPVPEPQPAPVPASSGGKMSQEEIEQMLRDMAAPKSDPEPAPEPEPAPALEPEPEEEPRPESRPEAECPAQEEPDIPFAPRETRLPDGAVCVNVMELLVDERLERYVRMFGLCTCPRCLADARALALTRLPPKYVVLSAMAATPMLSLYRAKFESQVIAQVIQACKTVMESPRHAQ